MEGGVIFHREKSGGMFGRNCANGVRMFMQDYKSPYMQRS